MKIIKFLKLNRKAIYKWVMVFVATAIIFNFCFKEATVERQYVSIGGEIFIWLIPVVIMLLPKIKREIREVKRCLTNKD